MAKLKNIKIVTDEENPQDMELIAKSIIEISDAFTKISHSRLRMRAVVLLLHDILKSKGVGIKEIELVLEYAPKLALSFTKPVSTPQHKGTAPV